MSNSSVAVTVLGFIDPAIQHSASLHPTGGEGDSPWVGVLL